MNDTERAQWIDAPPPSAADEYRPGRKVGGP